MSGYRMVRFEDLRACVCCLSQCRTGLSRFGYLVGRGGLVVPLCWTCGPLAENGGIRSVVCGICLDGGVVQAAPLRLECRCRPGSVRVTPVCPGHAERAVDPVRWRHTLVPNAGIARGERVPARWGLSTGSPGGQAAFSAGGAQAGASNMLACWSWGWTSLG